MGQRKDIEEIFMIQRVLKRKIVTGTKKIGNYL